MNVIIQIESKTMQCQQSGSPNGVFSFKRTTHPRNKLIDKNIPGVVVNERAHIVQCKNSQSEPTIVRAENPIETDASLSYFEVQVLTSTPEDSINIGLMARDNNTKQYIGKNNNSLGYHKGEVFLCKKKVAAVLPYQKLQSGDTVGVGLNCLKRTFFLVKNGKIVLNDIPVPNNWTEFYPGVGVSHENEKVQARFSAKEFRFDYLALRARVEADIGQDVRREETTNLQIYPLVYEYLAFHGYNKTLSALEDKEKDFHRVNRLCKHPGITRPAINLHAEKSSQLGEDAEMNEPLKVKLRNRIMSERLDQQMPPEQARRKNTEMAIEPQRKDSFIQNLSNASNYDKSEDNVLREEEQREMQAEPENQNERFLLGEGVEIVGLIREKKIEEAMELIERTVPSVLEDGHIVAFMKAHIFLRIVKEESSRAAIAYSQKEKDILGSNMGTLFPTYSSAKGGVEWKPLKFIYSALTCNTSKGGKQQCMDLLSSKQFEHFATFINCLIHKQMGYLGCSRLAFYINNTKKILQKLKDYKSMTCGIELKI